jgi:hypothetical protein
MRLRINPRLAKPRIFLFLDNLKIEKFHRINTTTMSNDKVKKLNTDCSDAIDPKIDPDWNSFLEVSEINPASSKAAEKRTICSYHPLVSEIILEVGAEAEGNSVNLSAALEKIAARIYRKPFASGMNAQKNIHAEEKAADAANRRKPDQLKKDMAFAKKCDEQDSNRASYKYTMSVIDMLFDFHRNEMLYQIILPNALYNASSLKALTGRPVHVAAWTVGYPEFCLLILHLLTTDSSILVPPKARQALKTNLTNKRNTMNHYWGTNSDQHRLETIAAVSQWSQYENIPLQQMDEDTKIRFYRDVTSQIGKHHQRMLALSRSFARLNIFAKNRTRYPRLSHMISYTILICCETKDMSPPSIANAEIHCDSSDDDDDMIRLLGENAVKETIVESDPESSSEEEEIVEEGGNFTTISYKSTLDKKKSTSSIYDEGVPEHNHMLAENRECFLNHSLCWGPDVDDDDTIVIKLEFYQYQIEMIKKHPDFQKFARAIQDSDASFSNELERHRRRQNEAFRVTAEDPYCPHASALHFANTTMVEKYANLEEQIANREEQIANGTIVYEPKPKFEKKQPMHNPRVSKEPFTTRPKFPLMQSVKELQRRKIQHIKACTAGSWGPALPNVETPSYSQGQTSPKMLNLRALIVEKGDTLNYMIDELNANGGDPAKMEKLKKEYLKLVARYKSLKATADEKLKLKVLVEAEDVLNIARGVGLTDPNGSTIYSNKSNGNHIIRFPSVLTDVPICKGGKHCHHGKEKYPNSHAKQICEKLHVGASGKLRNLPIGSKTMQLCYDSGLLYHSHHSCCKEHSAKYDKSFEEVSLTHNRMCDSITGYQSDCDVAYGKVARNHSNKDQDFITLAGLFNEVNASYGPDEVFKYAEIEPPNPDVELTKEESISYEKARLNKHPEEIKSDKNVRKFLEIVANPANKDFNAHKMVLSKEFTKFRMYKCLRTATGSPIVMCTKLATTGCTGTHPEAMCVTAALFHERRHRFQGEDKHPELIASLENKKIMMECFAQALTM